MKFVVVIREVEDSHPVVHKDLCVGHWCLLLWSQRQLLLNNGAQRVVRRSLSPEVVFPELETAQPVYPRCCALVSDVFCSGLLGRSYSLSCILALDT